MFLVDAEERVLLVHDRLDLDRDDSHWIAPGGGVEADESLREAALREVFEETGIRVELPVDAEVMFVEREVFWFAGEHIDQLNHYFLARVESGLTVKPTAPTDHETVVALGTRWWPLDELDAADVVRSPADIVEVIRRALAVN
jgi:8-oxo-dGTP pyrophosphatase MutT (NUDIX family)